jgi:hypothetical protein
MMVMKSSLFVFVLGDTITPSCNIAVHKPWLTAAPKMDSSIYFHKQLGFGTAFLLQLQLVPLDS